MSNIGFEYFYLSGKDIPLDDYNLGTIKQLTLNEFIDANIDINEFIQPFVLNKKVMLNKSDSIDQVLQSVGDLTFLFLYEQLTQYSIVSNLKKSLSMIYKTDNIYISNEKVSIVINGDYIIDDSNFSTLATVVCEMMGIDIEETQEVKPQTEMSEVEKEFERRRQKYLQMQKAKKEKKSDGYTILDIANVVIHFSSWTYDEVFNMTIYQLKNSFKALVKKDGYMVNLLHRISQKFDTSKEKFVHWTDDIKLDASSLNLKD